MNKNGARDCGGSVSFKCVTSVRCKMHKVWAVWKAKRRLYLKKIMAEMVLLW